MKKLLIDNQGLSSFCFPTDGALKRDRTRPVESRGPNYDQEYDFFTVFYDVFWNVDHSQIVITAPPFENFSEFVSEQAFTQNDSGLKFDGFSKKNWWNYSEIKLMSSKLSSVKNDASVLFDTPAGNKTIIPIRENHSELFDNKRVVMTMFKFDHPLWIKDWMEFYVWYHSADAFLIYNNASPFVTNEEIIQIASEIVGVKSIAVVDWPFLYGPQAEGTGLWDSVFTKAGFFEHSKQRFLATAKSVLNVDIDELVVTKDHQSVFEKVEEQKDAYLLFHGIWASAEVNIEEHPSDRRHVHYKCHGRINDDTRQCPSKWAVVPSMCPDDAQWTTHDIQRMPYFSYENIAVRYRHFRNLNIGWKGDRSNPLLEYNEDQLLIEAYQKVGWL
ncbi:hypothetical protein [Kordiimonas sp. SCSIO 12610]|uniref:hypothetical protein n=1 Tax=Kordiimonas sp. SCSIO 12610 TaxID=2829597 RepID=UPI002108D12E|nr:hypothetical protein [Kordiimonas sp. SCSIO 12610]UTW55781.1 hypothetical protein KFF44_02505 [Kordiimonas sp. SCSIO 12610]